MSIKYNSDFLGKNKEWLFDQYVNKGLSFIKISEILNCSPGIVEYYIKFFNINKK